MFSYLLSWEKENTSSLTEIFLWPSCVFTALQSEALQCMAFICWIHFTVQPTSIRLELLLSKSLTSFIIPHTFSFAWPQLNSIQFVHEWGSPGVWGTCLAFQPQVTWDAHPLNLLFLRLWHSVVWSHICILITYKFSFYLSILFWYPDFYPTINLTSPLGYIIRLCDKQKNAPHPQRCPHPNSCRLPYVNLCVTLHSKRDFANTIKLRIISGPNVITRVLTIRKQEDQS